MLNLCACVCMRAWACVRKMMAELFPSLEQELTNFEVFGIQINTTCVSLLLFLLLDLLTAADVSVM